MIDRLRESLLRFLCLLRRAQIDHDLDAEMGAHIELGSEENRQRGMSPEEARRHALLKLGGFSSFRTLSVTTKGRVSRPSPPASRLETLPRRAHLIFRHETRYNQPLQPKWGQTGRTKSP